MTGNLRHINNVMNHQSFSREKTVKVKEENPMPLVHEDCKCSSFGLIMAAAGLLVFAGIILYALVV